MRFKMDNYAVTLLCFITSCYSQTFSDVQRWMEEKVYPNNPHIRPALNFTDVVIVSISFHLCAITNFDEVSESLFTTGWLSVKWKDANLKWLPSDYAGLSNTTVPPTNIWTPNIAIANSVDELKPIESEFLHPTIWSNGTVRWTPGSAFRTSCKMNVESFPFDTQSCEIHFFVWGYDIDAVDLEPFIGHVDLDTYKENGEWEFVASSLRRELMIPEGKPHPMIVVTIKLKRRATVLIQSVIIPLVVLANINVLVFFIPVQTGEKISFSVTILLAFGVFLGFINDKMPKTSETTSCLSIYMTCLLTMSAIYVLLVVIIAKIHNKSPKEKISTGWLRLYECLSWPMCRKCTKPIKADVASENCNDDTNDVTWKTIAISMDKFLLMIFFPPIFLTSFSILILPSILNFTN